MARNEGQNRAMREAMRRRLLDAALELFAVKGYHAVAPKDIAAKAKASSGIFYHYFRNKQAMGRALVADTEQVLLRQIAPHFLRGKTIEEGCRIGYGAMLDFMDRNPRWFQFFLQERSNRELKPTLDAARDRLMEMAEKLLMQAQKTGKVRSELDPKVMMHLINEMGFEALRLYSEKIAPREAIVDTLARFVVSALRPRAKRRARKAETGVRRSLVDGVGRIQYVESNQAGL